jgi:DNA-binding NarL/FixJ family response regulator
MLTHITILIAYHHHVFRTIISHIVQSHTGFCVAACADTKEKLLERTKEFPPDVIITDIAPPGIGNPGTLQEPAKRHSAPRVIRLAAGHYDDALQTLTEKRLAIFYLAQNHLQVKPKYSGSCFTTLTIKVFKLLIVHEYL